MRRRARSKRLVFLDVALNREKSGPFLVAVELAADALGEEQTIQLRHDVRPGDVVVAEGLLLPSPSTGSALYVAELKCSSLAVHEKWNPEQGSFVPHALDEACASLAAEDGRPDEHHGAQNLEQAEEEHEPSKRAQDDDPDVPLCKAWINSGKCLKGTSCKFRHGTLGVSIGKARAAWVKQRRQARLVLPSTTGDTVKGEDKEDYKERAKIFSSWLEETFGATSLRKGVVDVAGGRGDLSFELSLVRGFPSTVVDPRPIRFSKRQHREVENMLAANQIANPEEVARMLKQCRAAGGKGACMCAHAFIKQRQGYFGTEFFEGDDGHAGRELVESAGVLVGLHPDEATDAIVTTAIQLGKPFAVVPCCVFSLQNPHRKLPSGAPVSSYEDYVEWLASQDASIRRAFLPLAGKNQVLYSRSAGETQPKAARDMRETDDLHE